MVYGIALHSRDTGGLKAAAAGDEADALQANNGPKDNL